MTTTNIRKHSKKRPQPWRKKTNSHWLTGGAKIEKKRKPFVALSLKTGTLATAAWDPIQINIFGHNDIAIQKTINYNCLGQFLKFFDQMDFRELRILTAWKKSNVAIKFMKKYNSNTVIFSKCNYPCNRGL